MLALVLGAAAASSSPTAAFDTPSLVGSSDVSKPNGTKFWFPSISIAIPGHPGHVAQHVTLAGDGGWGPAGPEGPCSSASRPQEFCEQIMLTRDGGRNYSLVKRASRGTSGNFNGYDDLGTWVPAPKGAPARPGCFDTIVGCNDCGSMRGGEGGALSRPAFLQTWCETSDSLRLTANVTSTFRGIPARTNLSTPSQTIVRTADGHLLLAAYGHTPRTAPPQFTKYIVAFFRSSDQGRSWEYASQIGVTPTMPSRIVGPSEPSMATLADGRVLAVFRLEGGSVHTPLWKAYSSDHGVTWTEPAEMRGGPGVMYGVWPQLLRLSSSGTLVLSSGRPGIGFWVAADAGGEAWAGHDVEAEHSQRLPDDPYTNASGTTSYTGIAEVEPGVVLLTYDKTGADRTGNIQKVFAVRITVG